MNYLQKIQESAAFLAKNFGAEVPLVGITLGSGLGDFGQEIKNAQSISFKEIPFFLSPSVEGHHGELIIGQLGAKKVVALKGRIHGYEGHSLEEVCFATRVLGVWGIKKFIITNASGGINLNYRPGQLVLISDHLNLSGKNPLTGPNLNSLGPRFPDMGHAYCPQLIKHFQKIGQAIGHTLATGIYAWLNGPTYETPAEIRMLKTLGADLVGMSTVPEVIVARHMGIDVCGISCVTNMAAGITDHPLNHEEVKEEAFKVRKVFSKLIESAVASPDFPA